MRVSYGVYLVTTNPEKCFALSLWYCLLYHVMLDRVIETYMALTLLCGFKLYTIRVTHMRFQIVIISNREFNKNVHAVLQIHIWHWYIDFSSFGSGIWHVDIWKTLTVHPMKYACFVVFLLGWYPWWRHQMETFSALLAICAGNSPVADEFPSQRPVTRSFGVFFDLRLNKRLSKQSWGWWFETLSLTLWRHCND